MIESCSFPVYFVVELVNKVKKLIYSDVQTMEFPIQPEDLRRPQAQREDEEEENHEEEPAAPLNPLFKRVIATLIVSFGCTVARLVFLVLEKRYWDTGVPTLCYGAIAAIPYSTLDTETAFTFEAISNAIAMQTYTVATTECLTKNYFISLSDGAKHSIYAYLSAISALDLFGIFVIQWWFWHGLYAKDCTRDEFRYLRAWNLIILSLDAVAIYEASRTKRATILALSAVIL